MQPTLTSPGDGPAMRDLYRFFDAEGTLLYVGISLNAAARASQHSKGKPWWPQVVRMDVEHFGPITRRNMERAEKAVIRLERPLHNVVHNMDTRPRDGRPLDEQLADLGVCPIRDGVRVPVRRCSIGAVVAVCWRGYWSTYTVASVPYSPDARYGGYEVLDVVRTDGDRKRLRSDHIVVARSRELCPVAA